MTAALAPRREGSDRPVDVRLAAVAAGCWATTFAALHLSATAAAGAAGAAAAVGVLLWWRYRARAWAALAVAVLVGAACGGAATAARLTARDAPAVAGPAAARAAVVAEVTPRKDPHRLAARGGRPPGWLVPAWLHALRPPAGAASDALHPVRVRVRVLVLTGEPEWQEVVPGQRVRTPARLAPPDGGDLTAAVLSATGPPEPVVPPPWHHRAASAMRDGLQRASAPLPDAPGGLVPGVAVGDTSTLDEALADDFDATGMSHLVAVSGTHCAIVTGAVFLLVRAARAPPWLVAVSCGAAVAGYAVLCQASPSVLRAGVMAAVALLALATGRARAALPALATAVLVLLVADPALAASPAFTMSVSATAGLVLLAPRWRDALRRRRVPSGVAEALAVPAAAQVTVAPVIAGTSGAVSLVAVAANLVATPVMTAATLLGVLAAVVSPVSAPLAALCAWLASWPAWWLVLVARYGAQVPGAVVPWPAGTGGALLLVGLTVVVLVAVRYRRVRVALAAVAAAVVLGALPVRTVAGGWPPEGAVVVACDVGQGDMLVLPVGPHAAVVVDAGPEPAGADRCLRDLDVRSVPLFVVSHYHADHVGGLPGVLRGGRSMGAVLVPPVTEPAYGHGVVAEAAEEGGVPVRQTTAGQRYRVGRARLRVLGPAETVTGTRSDANNNSLVLRAETAGVRVLLPGDVEEPQQQALLADAATHPLRADVLKVPHHGSPYQEPAFFDAVAPTVALVPVGADNTYGHPDPAVLTRLAEAGTRVLRTDRHGDVAVVASEGALAVVTRG